MILCQTCHTPNDDNAEICTKCGAALLIIGGGKSWDEANVRTISMEDHFLERISNLEETISGMVEHLSRVSENLEMVERNGFVTRSGLNALVETLRESNLLREELLYSRWENTMVEQMEEARFRNRFLQMRGRFLALFRGPATMKTRFINLIDEAEFLIYSDRILETTEALKKALDLDEFNYELAYYLAEFCQLQGGRLEALEYLDIALKANPDHLDSLLLSALITYGEQDVERAQVLLTRCLELNPNHPLALLSMGSLLTAASRFAEAQPYLERSAELDPQAQVYYLLGLGAREEGRLKEAIDYLGYATELDPEHEDAIFGLGLAYLKRGWNRKARSCFARALELNPNKVEFQEAAGENSDDQLEPTPETMDPNSAETLEKANTLFREGKLKAALPHYRRLIKKYPDNYVLLSTMAVLNYALRRFDESLKNCTKIMSMNTPEMVRIVAYTISMECLRGQGRYDESIELMTDMREEFPVGYGRTVACCGLALTKADIGADLREAEALATEALDHTPPDYRHNVLDALGWVYFKQGRFEDAVKLLKSAISMRETLNHLYHYGMVLLALNLQEEAFKIYETIVKLRGKNVAVEDFIFAAIDSELQSAEWDNQ